VAWNANSLAWFRDYSAMLLAVSRYLAEDGSDARQVAKAQLDDLQTVIEPLVASGFLREWPAHQKNRGHRTRLYLFRDALKKAAAEF